jgi:hypothetical protein
LLKPQFCDAYPQSQKRKVLTSEIGIFSSNYWKKTLKRSCRGFLGCFADFAGGFYAACGIVVFWKVFYSCYVKNYTAMKSFTQECA